MQDFAAKLAAFVAACQAIINEEYAKSYPAMAVPQLEIDPKGRNYARIVKVESHGGKSVYCFVDKDNGDILKAASWKAPAKHARGNIERGTAGMTSHGAYYLA